MDQDKREVLRSLSGDVATLTAEHDATAKLWFPAELLQPFFDTVGSAPTTAQIEAIPPAHKAALVLNLLTEDGLPHFHRLLATHLGDDGPWADWNNSWTAEENRHGNALDAYATLTGIVDRLELDKMKHAYIRGGFSPDWQHDPYKLLAYTSLQEHATLDSHRKLGRALSSIEPVLGHVLERIAHDEARHYAFYREVFKRILKVDPDAALISLAWVIAHFEMPGNSMPHFDQLMLIQERKNIFTTADYKGIVERLVKFLEVDKVGGLSTGKALQAQEDIMLYPKRLDMVIARRKKTQKERTISLPFLSQDVVV